jgi:uncharacterized protein YndB with AHSA1/START domain
MVSNTIEQEIHISAPVEQVWERLTDAAFLGEWFGNGEPVQLDLRVGGLLLFDHGVHGALPARIALVERPGKLSYRWSQGVTAGEEPGPDNATLVEITLVDDGDGTLARFRETGFATLPMPEAHLRTRYEQNSTGLPAKLEQLKRSAEQPGA